MFKKTLSSLALIFMVANVAFACRCMPPTTLTFQDYDGAALIMTGTVEEVQSHDDSNLKVILSVDKMYKGKETTKVVVITPSSTASCGLPFKEGKKWYVWANTDEASGLYFTNACSRSANIGPGGEETDNFIRYQDEIHFLNNLQTNRSVQNFRLNGEEVKGKLRGGERHGKWIFSNADGIVSRICKYKKGLLKKCIEK